MSDNSKLNRNQAFQKRMEVLDKRLETLEANNENEGTTEYLKNVDAYLSEIRRVREQRQSRKMEEEERDLDETEKEEIDRLIADANQLLSKEFSSISPAAPKSTHKSNKSQNQSLLSFLQDGLLNNSDSTASVSSSPFPHLHNDYSTPQRSQKPHKESSRSSRRHLSPQREDEDELTLHSPSYHALSQNSQKRPQRRSSHNISIQDIIDDLNNNHAFIEKLSPTSKQTKSSSKPRRRASTPSKTPVRFSTPPSSTTAYNHYESPETYYAAAHSEPRIYTPKSATKTKRKKKARPAYISYSNVRHLQSSRSTNGYNHSTINWYMNLCAEKYQRRNGTDGRFTSGVISSPQRVAFPTRENAKPKKSKVRWVGLTNNGRFDKPTF